jgi:PAS domain S-box-containing protein
VKKPINFLYWAGFLALLILGINLGVIFLVHSQELRASLSDTISPIVDLLASAALFVAAKYSTPRSKHLAMAWGWLALATFLYALGDIIWLILEVVLKTPPFPSIADGFYLAYYPVSLVGVFLLMDKSASTGERINRGLDIGIILGAAILGFWNFLIGPIIISNVGEPLLEQAILMAYPVGDLVLCGALLLIIYNRSDDQNQTPIFFLFGSLLVTIIADSIYSYQSLLGTYVSGGLLDLGWIVSMLLIGLAGVAQFVAIRSTNIPKKSSPEVVLQGKLSAISLYLPYFWLVGAYVLLVIGGVTPLPMSFLSLSISVGAIIILVLVRQVITLSENKKLNGQLQTTMGRYQAQSAELEKTNQELRFDITVRKKTQDALMESERRFATVFRASPICTSLTRLTDGEFLDANDEFLNLFGYSREELIGNNPVVLKMWVQPQDRERMIEKLQAQNRVSDLETQFCTKENKIRDVNVSSELIDVAGERYILGLTTDITERKLAESERKHSEAVFRALFELSPDSIVLIDPHDAQDSWPIIDCNKAACLISGFSRDELIGQSIDILNATPGTLAERTAYRKQLREAGNLNYEVAHRHKDGSVFPVEVSTAIFTIGGRELVLGIDRDITARIHAEEEIKQRLAELEAVNQISTALRVAQTLDEMLPLLLDTTLEVLHATQGAIWLHDPVKNELQIKVIRGWDTKPGRPSIPPEKLGEGVNGYAFGTGQPYIASDFHLDARLLEAVRQWMPPGIGGAVIPIRAGQNVIGMFDVNVSLPRELTLGEIHLLTTLSEIAGNAIQRTTLHQQTERRLQQLTALSSIDRIISSTFDLHLSLGLLSGHVAVQLGVDATDILLFNPNSNTLEFSVGRGFRTKPFEHAKLRLGEGFAGQAALTREIIHVPNLAVEHNNLRLEKHLADEQFVSYYGVPLISKGQIMGVLEVFQRTLLEPDKEWLDFLGTMAEQAAIAIDSVMQFDNVQRSNSELSQAYDETIEGWSHALDLRDHETEGHTQRVTEMTVALAREAGLDEAELLQVRWGSLLHDIGKMGIPDRILLKPGPLTDEEWVIMKKHPTFAWEMISPIRYLHTALDIPYCHHEKWDGTGYPRGLRGAQIPIPARIFAVVDVYDALTSDRPYRKAWSKENTLDHIREQSGKHFDPEVVDTFLKVIAGVS